MTAIYSILHMLVDGMCALAMFGRFLSRGNGHIYILLYNFCAFALQMPLGVALDALCGKGKGRSGVFPFLFAAAGVLCTIAGAFTHPVVLGIGNALFHVGGGVGTIREDTERDWQGRGLGIFVAPGALGLYLGTLFGKDGSWNLWLPGIGTLMLMLCALALYQLKGWDGRNQKDFKTIGNLREGSAPKDGRKIEVARGQKDSGQIDSRIIGIAGKHAAKGVLTVAVCCMAVVILRSYVGMAVTFPWKTGVLAGTLAVLAVVGGKIAGGFAAARYGFLKTTVLSLGLAGICYLLSSFTLTGLAALFLFNMTMPITLYWMVRSMPEMPGFAFGFLTFALFLGFLPAYFGVFPAGGGEVMGCAGSMLSMLVLAAGYLSAGIHLRDSSLRAGNSNGKSAAGMRTAVTAADSREARAD